MGTRSSAAAPANELRQEIADLYDSSSDMWEEIWGDHIHHGFYDLNAAQNQHLSLSDHKAAQIRMIEEVLAFARVPEEEDKKPRSILDVGCGTGGGSRYLAGKYGCSVMGITLSPHEANRATFLTSAAGLTDKVEFKVADALNQPFPDGHFDLVWSMESAEQMPDKEKLVKEMVRVAAPGGRIILSTSCHRDLLPEEDSLKPNEQELLDKLYEAFYLPAWCSRADYVKLAQSLQLEDINTADWTENVKPYWSGVIRSFFSWKAIIGLLKSGWKAIKGSLSMYLMVKGHNQGLIKLIVISARKPT